MVAGAGVGAAGAVAAAVVVGEAAGATDDLRVAALLDSPEVSPWLLEPDATELLLNTVFIRFIYLEMPSLSSL